MGYITTVLSPEERDRAGPKSGAQAAATVSLDPLGGVSVAIDSVPQGQGHCTATAQIVADIFGLAPEAIRVEAAIDTGKDAWSIAAGNYSSRFAGATAGAAHIAATRLRGRLARIAAAQMNLRREVAARASAGSARHRQGCRSRRRRRGKNAICLRAGCFGGSDDWDQHPIICLVLCFIPC